MLCKQYPGELLHCTQLRFLAALEMTEGGTRNDRQGELEVTRQGELDVTRQGLEMTSGLENDR